MLWNGPIQRGTRSIHFANDSPTAALGAIAAHLTCNTDDDSSVKEKWKKIATTH